MSQIRSLFKRPYDKPVELPAKYIVCPDCDGRGTELRGGLKGMAFSREDIAEDPEFFEDYCSGAFDTACSRCNGRTTVPDFDVQAMTLSEKRMAATIRREWREKSHNDHIDRQIRRAESGNYDY